MQLKALLLALVSFGAVALAAPADLVDDSVDTTGLTQADLDFCERFDRRYERRECREDRRDGPRRCRDRYDRYC